MALVDEEELYRRMSVNNCRRNDNFKIYLLLNVNKVIDSGQNYQSV